MGNKSKQNRSLLDQSREQDNQGYNSFIFDTQNQYGKDRDYSNTLRNDIYNRYSNSNNFMPEGLVPNSDGWFSLKDDGSGGGGGVGADFSEAKGSYRNFLNNGGINRSDFDPALRSYQGFMSDGGLSSGTKDNMRYRATSMIPSFYDKYKQNLQRRSNVQGGYSPGFDSQTAEIGREASRAGYDASRQAEGDIADKELQGKMFGTTGFGNLMSNISGMEQSGKEFGTSGLKGIADSELSASEANASLGESRAARNQAMQQFLMSLYSGGKKDSAAGLSKLYTDTPGSNDTGRLLLAALGGRSGANNQNLALRAGVKGIDWGKVAGSIGTGAATAAMFL